MMKTDQFLLEELQHISKKIKGHSKELLNKDTAHTLTFQYEEIDFTELLNHVLCEKIFFFKSKYKNLSFLGLGQSQIIKASELSEYLVANPQNFLIATFLFEQDPNAAEFSLPEWSFLTQNGKTQLNIYPSFEYKNISLPNLFFNQNFDLELYDPTLAPWTTYNELPEHDQWEKMIAKCDELFDQKKIQKIVLSRKKIFEYDDPISPIAFFKAILSANNNANSSYAIFNQINFEKAFISLTPEKLFSLENQHFESIALAASAPRGKTIAEDESFEQLLNSSDKLAREHSLVTEEIIKKITPMAVSLTVFELQTMKLPYIQHRSIPIHALMHPNITALELTKTLHPTPAVGGMPTALACKKFLELEPYARQSYAAPIGVVSLKYSELAVGIRSALIENNKLTIFGGAGIVKGSFAEDEWIETGIKMNPFLKVINHE
ncbi:MAG: isochorismate synthase [Bacteriovorax sp.]|nr:isochorismate synthase [Bacteriovorax sp.]